MRVPWEPSSCAFCRRLRSKFRSRTGISAAARFGSMGIGRKGRSCAWSPSRGVTSKSPMHAGVASSLPPHATVARRARQRRRVYQSGKGRATNRGGPAGKSVADVEREGSTAPGAASAARAGVRISVAGRSAVFRRRRFGPALLREAPRCSCPAVACGDRGVSDSTWAAGLLFGADGVAVTVSVDRTAGDASLATATTSRATTVSASMQDICRVPSRPANIPEVSRGRRLPYSMSTTPAIGRLAHPVRFAPTARRSSGMAHPCPRGCISRRSSAILAYRATALWHLGVAIHELWMPRPHRISTGCLVSPVCRDGSRPRCHRAAPTWALQ